MDVRRMRAEKKGEEVESTPKRAKRAVVVEEKGTNTSTGDKTERLEWENDKGTETDWQEVKTKKKTHQRKEKKRNDAREGKVQANIKRNIIPATTNRNLEDIQIQKRKHKTNTTCSKQSGRKPTAKPEALLVEVNDRDYASVLKEVKTGLASQEVVFSKVRKTRNGDILLELEKGQNGGASQIKEKVEGLCPSLTLRALKESADVIIKGLDITVEKEELEEYLKQNVKEFRLKSFWGNRYGNKTAVIELPKDEAQKFVEQKKVKIGWMRLPVGLLVDKKRCYRCLEYGHISMGCPGQDRSRKCYNCGHEGHKAKDCVNETACAICLDKGKTYTNHRMGSKNCPSWNEKVPGKRSNNPKNGI